MRRRNARRDVSVRQKEQAVDTARRRAKRMDPDLRAQEQIVNTLQHRDRRMDPEVREEERPSDAARQRAKRREADVRAQVLVGNRLRRKRMLSKSKYNKTAKQRLHDFRLSVADGCIFVCVVCNRMLFQSNVCELSRKCMEGIDNKYPNLLEDSVDEIDDMDAVRGKQYLCNTCKKYLNRGKIPPMSVKNGLRIVNLVNETGEILDLTELESTLVAKNILFMKIFQLPKSRWSAIKDKTINVPIRDRSVLETVQKLPRLPSEAGIIPVQLKRKKNFKNYHIKQYIRPSILRSALAAFRRAGNKYYQFVDLNEDFEEQCRISDPDGYQLLVDPDNPDDPPLQESIDLTTQNLEEEAESGITGTDSDSQLILDQKSEINGADENVLLC